jgi:adenylate kinase
VQRSDDQEPQVRERLRVFKSTTDPLRSYYRPSGLLLSIDAERSPDQVFETIVGGLSK